MSNEIKNQVQETEVEADGELNEEALMSVAGGAGAQQAPAQQASKPSPTLKTVVTTVIAANTIGSPSNTKPSSQQSPSASGH